MQIIQNKFNFKWNLGSLPYLGIQLTSSIETIYRANYPPLFKKLREDLRCWADYSLSWFGRINSIKMMWLQRLLYYFRTLPVAVPRGDIQRLQAEVMRFIWGHTRPRIQRRTLYTPKLMGVLGLPNLQAYYQSAQIAQLAYTTAKGSTPLWVSIEALACNPLAIGSIMWLPNRRHPSILCPTLSHSLAIWDTIVVPYHLLTHHWLPFSAIRSFHLV